MLTPLAPDRLTRRRAPRPASREGNRLSVGECRRQLGVLAENVPDAEIETLRNQLYALAGACCSVFRATSRRDFESAIASLDPSTREDAQERAAILEFDGALSRTAAEAVALSSTQRETQCMRSSTAASQPKSRRRT
jgi:hypothetical protein